jgi:response regulator NasT
MMTDATDKPGPRAGPAPPDRDHPPRPGSILVADDEHLVASGIAAHLQAMSYRVIGPACDGVEAIELCRTERPDLAILDIRMPRMDGIAAAAEIFHELSIPAMILSAYSDSEYVDGARDAGVFGFLLKPVAQDQLDVAISVAWARYLEHLDQHSTISTLAQRLEDRKVIEQAKWVLVKTKGLDEPDAMRLLQRQARNHRRRLADVARSVIESEELLGEGTEGLRQ